jgi:hypothetical protein
VHAYRLRLTAPISVGGLAALRRPGEVRTARCDLSDLSTTLTNGLALHANWGRMVSLRLTANEFAKGVNAFGSNHGFFVVNLG